MEIKNHLSVDAILEHITLYAPNYENREINHTRLGLEYYHICFICKRQIFKTLNKLFKT